MNTKTVYKVTINMKDGGQRLLTLSSLNGMSVGTKVYVDGDALRFRE